MNHQNKPGYKRKLFFKKLKVSFNSFISDWLGDISILHILKKIKVLLSNHSKKIKFFLFFGLTVFIILFFIDEYQKKQNYMYEQQRLLGRELRLELLKLENIKYKREQQEREEEIRKQQRREEEQRLEEEQQRREEEQRLRGEQIDNFLKKIKKIPSSIVLNKIFIDSKSRSNDIHVIDNIWSINKRFSITNESNWKIERVEVSLKYYSSLSDSFLKEDKIIFNNYGNYVYNIDMNNTQGLPLSTSRYEFPNEYKYDQNQYIKWKIESIYGYELSN